MRKLPFYSLIVLLACVSGLAVGETAVEIKSPAEYVLHEGDMLEISVWKEEGLARELMVAPDGNISFPLIGQIMAKGRSVQGLEQDMAKRLSTFIPEPSITVILKGAAGSKFYVIGKVNRPGEFPLLGPTSVLQALSVAGGMTTFADVNDIKVIRHRDGQQTTLPFRYGDIEEGESLKQNIQLVSGDVVVVP